MDGTLLDLGFDLRFWRDTVPRRYAALRCIPRAQAITELRPMFESIQGTLDWYCIDHWSRQLGLDIARMHRVARHEVTWLPQAREFVARLRRLGRRVVLVTNSHPETLAIKDSHVRVCREFDAVYSSHQFRMPKENADFWTQLAQHEPYDPARTLFADDSLAVLRAAKAHGIAWVYGIRRPAPCSPRRDFPDIHGVDAVHELADQLPEGA